MDSQGIKELVSNLYRKVYEQGHMWISPSVVDEEGPVLKFCRPTGRNLIYDFGNGLADQDPADVPFMEAYRKFLGV